MFICNGNSCSFTKRHFKIAVHTARWIYYDRQRRNVTSFAESVAEEISQWSFYRRSAAVVPIDSEYNITHNKTSLFCIFTNRHPDMTNDSRSFYICNDRLFSHWKTDTSSSFSLRSECTVFHACSSLFSRRIFRRYCS